LGAVVARALAEKMGGRALKLHNLTFGIAQKYKINLLPIFRRFNELCTGYDTVYTFTNLRQLWAILMTFTSLIFAILLG